MRTKESKAELGMGSVSPSGLGPHPAPLATCTCSSTPAEDRAARDPQGPLHDHTAHEPHSSPCFLSQFLERLRGGYY